MGESIIPESRYNAKLPTDLDNYRSCYEEFDSDSGISVVFPSGEIYAFERNLFLLLSKARKVKFLPEWTMRPDYVSKDYYNTEMYWPIILFINNTYSMEDFYGFEEILIPSFNSLLEITKFRVPESATTPLRKIEESENKLLKYLKRHPLDNIEIEMIEARKALEEEPIGPITQIVSTEITEEFTLTAEDIANKYIKLQYCPANTSSVVVEIDGYDIVQNYGYDFTLKYDSDFTCRLIVSWASADVIGNGLEHILEIGDVLVISYIYEEEVQITSGELPDPIDGGWIVDNWLEEYTLDGGWISSKWYEENKVDCGNISMESSFIISSYNPSGDIFDGGSGNGGYTVTPPTTFNLTVNVNPSSYGHITLSPSQSGYENGTVVSIYVTAATGWQFDHWIDNGSMDNPRTIVMKDDLELTVLMKVRDIVIPYPPEPPIPPSDGDGAPEPPINLTSTIIDNSTIRLSWTDMSLSEVGFRLERSLDGTTYFIIATTSSNITMFDDTQLLPGSYFYRVQAYNTLGNSVYSNVTSKTLESIPEEPTPEGPSAPTGLTATVIGDDLIRLSWTDTSINETGFRVDKSVDDVTYFNIATLPAGTITYDDENLNQGIYYYRIQAYNLVGNSNYSNVANAIIVAPPEQLYTIFTLDDSTVIQSDVKKLGVVLSGPSNFAAGHYLKNMMDNPGFEDGIYGTVYHTIGVSNTKAFHDASVSLPLSPVNGDRYICSVAGNGWVKNSLYLYNGTTWTSGIPSTNRTCFVVSENKTYTFDGTDWVLADATEGSGRVIKTLYWDTRWNTANIGLPVDFWNGGTFEIVYGGSKGRTGNITDYTWNSNVPTFVMDAEGTLPSSEDIMICRVDKPLGGANNSSDVRIGTPGVRSRKFTGTTDPNTARYLYYYDSYGRQGDKNAGKLIKVQGEWKIGFWAKGLHEGVQLKWNLSRYPTGGTFLNYTFNLSTDWAYYEYIFTVDPSADVIDPTYSPDNLPPMLLLSAYLPAGLGKDLLIDDMYLGRNDYTNPTPFIDELVNSLKDLKPGVIRNWSSQHGDRLDNQISHQHARKPYGFEPRLTGPTDHKYGFSLHEFLELCEEVGDTEPWYVIPPSFTLEDMDNLAAYLSAPVSSGHPYAIKRQELGHEIPWTDVFTKIHLEWGNECWGSNYSPDPFVGASVSGGLRLGIIGTDRFNALKSNVHYIATSDRYEFILGGQAAFPGRQDEIDTYGDVDMVAVAPYFGLLNQAWATPEDMFYPLYAGAYIDTINAAGLGLQSKNFLSGNGKGTKLGIYEVNFHTVGGAAGNYDIVNSFVASVAGGINLSTYMMLYQKHLDSRVMCAFTMVQFSYMGFGGSDYVRIWGLVRDLVATGRKRPTLLAMELANKAIMGDMINITKTGVINTRTQPPLNYNPNKPAPPTITFPLVETFAYKEGNNFGLYVCNMNVNSSESIKLNLPGTIPSNATLYRLVSSSPTDTNEDSELVTIETDILTDFESGYTFTIPPYSIYVFNWTTT